MRLVGSVIVVLAVVALACGRGGGDDEGITLSNPTFTPAEDEATLRAEAETLCPEIDGEISGECITRYMAQAQSNSVTIMCVNPEDGQSYFAPPGATPDASLGEEDDEADSVGENCREPGHVAVALLGGG